MIYTPMLRPRKCAIFKSTLIEYWNKSLCVSLIIIPLYVTSRNIQRRIFIDLKLKDGKHTNKYMNDIMILLNIDRISCKCQFFYRGWCFVWIFVPTVICSGVLGVCIITLCTSFMILENFAFVTSIIPTSFQFLWRS